MDNIGYRLWVPFHAPQPDPEASMHYGGYTFTRFDYEMFYCTVHVELRNVRRVHSTTLGSYRLGSIM